MKRPHRFEILIEPAFSKPTQYSIENGHVMLRRDSTEHRATTPTLAQWSGFWRLCEFLDLWNWKREYTPIEQMRPHKADHARFLVVLRPEQQEAFDYAVPRSEQRLNLEVALAEVDEEIRSMNSLL